MSKPLPRWARHRCAHPNRVEVVAGFRVVRDYCPDCAATFPAQKSKGAPLTPADEARQRNRRILQHEIETPILGHTATCCDEVAAPTQDPTP